MERRLKRFVSKQSKIDIEEIERRIQRKKNSKEKTFKEIQRNVLGDQNKIHRSR